MHTPAETPPVTPDVPTPPDPSTDPAHAPVSEPSIDTTRREAPGRSTPDPVKATLPKLPHERDESVDMTHGIPDKNVQQAYRDLQRGLQDTDRGPAADKAYKKL